MTSSITGGLNPELGTEDDFARLSDALRGWHMGLLLDWVPNHMGIGAARERGLAGQTSRTGRAPCRPTRSTSTGTACAGSRTPCSSPSSVSSTAPSSSAASCASIHADGWLRLTYFDRSFLASAQHVAAAVSWTPRVARVLAADDEAQQELLSISVAIEHLPGRNERDDGLRQERAREKEVIKRRFYACLVAESAAVLKAFEAALVDLNGTIGVSTSFDALDAPSCAGL